MAKPKEPRVKITKVDKKLNEVSKPNRKPLTSRQVDAAAGLGATVSNAPKSKGGGNEQPVLPVGFNRKPNGDIKTPDEVKHDYPNMDDAQLRYYRELYNNQVAGRNPSVATLINRVTDGLSYYAGALENVPGAIMGDKNALAEVIDQTNLAIEKRNQVLNQLTGNHLSGQASVGGTKGSTTVVDRSAAVKKAWLTRRQMYGSSGRKDS